jgi:endogenous inhibitor of DNA gyrase (YacG/DUF329 family)
MNRDRAKCVTCNLRINAPSDPYCCQVCRDSDVAAKRRQNERLR